jgi:DHA2 family multidrug resistance protein
MGALALCLGYSVFFSSLVILPLWLQTQLNYTAQWAGFVLAPAGVLALIISPLVGRTMQGRDLRWYATFAFIVFAITSFWRATFSTEADFTTLVLPQILQGIAIATFFAPLITINMSGIPPARIASASGLQNFLRMMAGSFGTSLAVTLWDQRAALHRSQLTDHLNNASQPLQDYLGQIQGAGVPREQAFAQIDHMLTVQSYTLAANDLFWLGGCLLVLLIFVIWQTRPPFGGGNAGAH